MLPWHIAPLEQETPSTSFYQRVKWMKGKGHAIPRLKDSEGVETSKATEMVGVVSNYTPILRCGEYPLMDTVSWNTR